MSLEQRNDVTASARSGAPERAGPIAVCFCVDEVMSMPVAAAMASILISRAPGTRLEFHVIGIGLTRRSQDWIAQTAGAAAPVHFHHIEGEMRRRLDRVAIASTRPYPTSAYVRVMAGTILPERLDRVLYFDADVAAVTDLTPLWETDLGGAAMAGCRDIVPNDRRTARILGTLTAEDRDRYAYRADQVYLSSGVLVLDLPRLRGQAERDLMAVLERYPNLHFPDQDALNIVLGAGARLVDLRWNQTPAAFEAEAPAWTALDAEELEVLRRDPWIVHYAGRPKPWETGCTHPFLPQWQEAYRRTPWSRDTHATWRYVVERSLRARRVLRKRAVRLIHRATGLAQGRL